MNTVLTPIERCAEVAGLAPHEIVIGVSPSKKHARLLAKYRPARRSRAVARARIVADIRAAVAAGATGDAADLLIVLRRLLALEAPRLSASSCARRRDLASRGRVASPTVAPPSRGGPEPNCPGATVLRLPPRAKKPAETVV